ncbi:Fc.00g047470.m01.CDS01 [Cosmosporella sp. VM-42]
MTSSPHRLTVPLLPPTLPAISTSTPTTPAMDKDGNPKPILKIPLEILLRITYHLTTPELGKLRLTSRHFEQSLDPTFIKEFFTRKQFMITYESLQALIDISKSRLGPHLRIVHIGLDQFGDTRRRPGGDANQVARYAQLGSTQYTLWKAGYHRDMLAEAFRNLTNLQDVVIRDFNSHRRSRDGPNAQWRSYGATTVFRETGIWLRQGNSNGILFNQDLEAQYSNHVMQAVLYALVEAGARPKGIEFMSRARNHLQGLAFNIPAFLEGKVLPVLSHLEKLHVDVDVSGLSVGPGIPMPLPGQPSVTDPMIQKFLLSCTNLKHLRINEHHGHDRMVGPFLQWLGDSNAAGNAAASPAFEHLEELNLGLMNVEAPWVLNIIRKYAPTLKRLELWKLTLQRSIPTDSIGAPPKTNFWSKFLEKLKDIPNLNLHHIKVGAVQQQWRERTHRSIVSFRGKESTMEYTGTDWKHFVEEMIPKVEVAWNPADDHPILDDDDDDDDDDEGIWDQYALDL